MYASIRIYDLGSQQIAIETLRLCYTYVEKRHGLGAVGDYRNKDPALMIKVTFIGLLFFYA